MKKLIAIATIALAAIASIVSADAQVTDPVYWHYKQKHSNWLFEYDTVRINCLRIDNKLAIDSLGRIWWYDNTVPSLGELLVGNGTYYAPLSIGTSGQVLTVSGGTAIWSTPTLAGTGITGLTENLFLYGAADGSIDQDGEGFYNPATNYMRLGDPGGGDPSNPGTYVAVDGTNGASMSPTGIGLSVGGLGTMTMYGDVLEFMDPGGDLFKIGRASWSADMNLYFPSAKGTTGQSLYVTSVVGDDVTLAWQTALTAEVDGSTTNEVQNLSYDAGNHEIDISLAGTSATIPLADDDGATEGLASFTASDFNVDANGNVSLDYTNAQKATSGQNGIVTSTDWSTFNNKAYTLSLTGSQGTMTDAQTYYSGAITTGTSTTAAINQVPIPQSGTIVAIYVYQLTAGTLATTETSTLAIRLNNTTDVTVSSAVLNSAASSTWSATGLSQAVSAGDYIELKFTGATWATNPSNVRWTAVVLIR